MSKNILVISYFAGRDGCCPAEWLDDKLDSLLKINLKITLISSICSKPIEHPSINHVRVPSLSYSDFKHEVSEARANGILSKKVFLWLPGVLVIGIPLDILQFFITKGLGGGKWSWSFSSFITALKRISRSKFDLILTTGGPASAHLSGVACGVILKKRAIVELQDPLSGKDIGRNSRSAKLLSFLEKLLVKYSYKTVFVTKNAATDAIIKHGRNFNITAIYPGARKIEYATSNTTSNEQKIKLIHLGTLYSTRNLDTLIQAIDSLIEEDMVSTNCIEILNLGDIYGDFKKVYLSKPYFRQMSILPRDKAITLAAQYSACILVQHSDDRSKTTIPYKTYDYLNLNKPILALTNNDELSSLLEKQGHFCAHVKDTESVKKELLNLIQHLRNGNHKSFGTIDPVEQTKELIS